MSEPSDLDVALRFVEAINSGSVDRILAMISEDHVLIDSSGEELAGKDAVAQAWSSYFLVFPDYSIRIEEVAEGESLVALFGTASGTYSLEGKLLPENHWQIPVAWTVRVMGEKVTRWQIYADNAPVRGILDQRGWPKGWGK